LLRDENDNQINAFLAAHPEWRLQETLKLTPLQGGDGFFLAILTRVVS
jgi:16S rRNA (cytosine967-C5)-methyltransferase